MNSIEKYTLLSEEDSEQELPSTLQSSNKNRWSTTRKAIYVFFPIILLALVVLVLDFSINSWNAKPVWTNCGNSTAEAKENGCRFDVMMHSWVPQACYDEALSEEYIQANDFKFFSDPEA
jgi:hypothetical protein